MPDRRPNILWIVTTQWRAQSCGFAGDRQVRTGNLDRLAASAAFFTSATTPHPFGPFARAALLTGVPSPANGVRDYFDPLPPDTRTIAHLLAERGYATAWFGKWHLARRDPQVPLVGDEHARIVVPPESRGGFAFWEGFESGFLLNDPWLHGTRLPEPTRFPGYQADVVAGRAMEYLKDRDGPWFAVVSLEPPHPPYLPAPDGFTASDPARIELEANVPRGSSAEARARRELAGYHAHIEATDRALGRLIDGLPQETAVVFTSVHGDMHGAHGLFRKGWPHEESVRVPLLVRVPGWAPGPRGDAVSLLDLPGLTGAIADGRPWYLEREYAPISMPSVVRLPHQCDRVWRGARAPGAKVILNEDGSPWLVFDLERDPLERENLAGTPRGREVLVRWADRIGVG